MLNSIRKKMLFFILLPVVAISASTAAWNIFKTRQWNIHEARRHMTVLVENQASQFDSQLREVAQIALATATFLESAPNLTEENIYSQLDKTVRRSSLVYGAAVAFEPYQFIPEKELFAPYVYQADSEFKQMDIANGGYDYTDPKWEWWHSPKEKGLGVWTDPFFDEGAGDILMCTFSAPFFQDNQFRGVATVDIPLVPLKQKIAEDMDDFWFSILTKTGQYVYSHRAERIMKQNLRDVIVSEKMEDGDEIANQILSGESGSVLITNQRKQTVQWTFYAPIPSTGWILATTLSEEIALEYVRAQLYQSLGGLGLSLILIVICIWFVSKRITDPISQLNEATQQISEGHLETSIAVQSKDEVGSLAVTLQSMARKIIERERALEKERQSHFGQLVDGLGGKYFYYTHNIDGVFTYVSPSIKTILGYTPEDFMNHFETFLPNTELNKSAVERTEGSMRGEQQPVYNIDIFHQDGSIRRIEVFERPIYDDEKRVIGIEGMSCDITERVAEGEKFAALLNSSPDGMIISNDQGEITLVNTRAEELFGYNRDELVGQPVEMLIPENLRSIHIGLRETFDTADALTHMGIGREVVGLRKDGSEVSIEINLSPIKTDEGIVFSAAIRDITERKKVEQALRDSEEYKSAILESSLDCLVSMDHEGNIIEFNPAAESVFGYNHIEVMGKTLSETIVPLAFREAHEKGLKHYLQTGEGPVLNQRIEITAMRANGEEFPVELAIIPIEHSDPPVFTAFIRDITDRKKAEEALAESENRLNLAMDTSGVGLWDFNIQTGDTYLSPQYFALLGYEPNELTHGYDTWQKLLHADDREQVTEQFGQFISSDSGNDVYEDEYRMYTKAGEDRWILARGGVVERDEKNSPIRLIGTHVDITERKQSEDLLAKQELEARLLHKSTQIASETDSFEESLQRCIDIICELTSWPIGHAYIPTKNDPIELTSTAIWHIGDSAKYAEFRKVTEQSSFAKGVGLPGRILESGEPVWIVDVQQDANFPRNQLSADIGVRGAFGFPIKISGESVAVLEFFAEQEMAPDQQLLQTIHSVGAQIGLVLERKRAQDKLAQYVDQQNASLEVGRAVLRIRDQDDLEEVLRTTDQELRKLNISFRSVAIHRLVDEETKLFDSYVFIDSSKFERLHRPLPGSYDMWKAGQFVYRKNRNKIIESTSELLHERLSNRHGYNIGSILDVPHARGILTVLSDQDHAFPDEDIQLIRNVVDTISVGISRIEDLEQLENRNQDLLAARDEAEKAAREAEAANQAKSIFLANMSHEIRTPMNAILGFSDILGSTLTEPQQKTYLDSIQSSGKSLLRLINDILDLSKVEAGKLELELSPIETRKVFLDIEQEFAQTIKEKEIGLDIDIHSDVPDLLSLDGARLRQVLVNVVGNAVKFTEEGQVTLRVSSTKSRGNHVNLAIEVEDTGVGIPEDQIDRIFGAFEQRAGQSINEYGGTGLGLAITTRLIDMMGGDIAVTSQLGEGSTFTIALNDVKIASTEDVVDQTLSVDVDTVSFDSATILVTDDIEVNRELIKGYLLPYGFTLLEARDGQIAIDLMRKQKPDLTLMDIKMPVLDGYTATKLIRKDAEVSDLVIVALTDATMRETEEEISQTCDGFLQNPVSKEALITELIKHLPHHIISPEIYPSNASPESALTELTGEALEKLPTLIEHLKEHQETSADLAHTQTINEVEDFAQHMQSLGEEYAYPPLVQWGEQLLLQATTFDLENMGKTLANYGRLIEEAESQLASTVSTDVENEVGSIDLELLLDTLYSDKKTWETLSQTLTINDIEDFAQRMQVLGQDHRYEPLVNWSAKLTEQASLFDMDNMAKTLGRYPEFIDAIEAQL